MNQNNRRSTDKLQKRPDVLGGCTYKIKWPSSEHALYVTINDFIGSDGVKKPFELFLNTKDPTHKDWMVFADGWQSTTDMHDLADFANQWMRHSSYCADIAPEPNGDGLVNILDFALFARNWLESVE